jgi:hypothetical protein
MLAAAVVVLTGHLAWSADLAKVERRILKEPAYESKKPKYCLLAIRPEAKTRIWLVQDGDLLYVDKNGTGDLTEKGKRLAASQKAETFRNFTCPDLGDESHTELTVTELAMNAESVGNEREWARIRSKNPEGLVWFVSLKTDRPKDDARPLPRRIGYLVNGDGTGYLIFGDCPEEAPIIHVNDQWTFALQDVKQRLRVGFPSNLQVGVGTPGLGAGTFAWVLYTDTIPIDAYPEAHFTFPPKDPGSRPIERAVLFKKRC